MILYDELTGKSYRVFDADFENYEDFEDNAILLAVKDSKGEL